MIRATEQAAADAGAGALLSRIDWALVPQGGWAWPDPARLVTDAVGSPHARTTYVELGILQQTLFTRAVESILRGHTDVVLIAGGEARYRDVMHRKATNQPAPVREQAEAHPNSRWKPEQEILSRVEIERLLATPAHQYAIIENARRALDGQSVPEHTAAVADLWSRFSQVAAGNPDAWRREPMAARELQVASEGNQWMAWPYTKWHCSQWNVDQAAAFLLCSTEVADALGIAADRRIYPVAAAESNHMIPLSRRAEPGRSPAIAQVAQALTELSGVAPADVPYVDLYSCFPIAVRNQARELGIALDPAPTLTGGMSFAGGPLNNYVLQAMVKVVQTLRQAPAALALSTSISGIITKQGAGLWSARPPAADFRAADVSEAAAKATQTVEVDPEAIGEGTIAGYTVAHPRTQPPTVVALVDLADGRRALATNDDADVVADLMAREGVGRPVAVEGAALRVD
jgi:acetyl-CoA C-acetyltransferase